MNNNLISACVCGNLNNKNKTKLKNKLDFFKFKIDDDETEIYENSFNLIDNSFNSMDKSNCTFSRSVLTFKSTPIKSTNCINLDKLNFDCNKSLNLDYLLNKNPINHECIEKKIIKTKLNSNQNLNKTQKCIHWMHPGNLNEGCLVCNSLIEGRKLEKVTFTSFKEEINSNKQLNQNCSNLINELKKLNRTGWYWASMDRSEAELKLKNEENGTFLIRDSYDKNYILSLSFKIKEGVFHTRITFDNQNGLFSFYLQPNKKYKTISELVDHLILNSKVGINYYIKSKKENKEIKFLIKLDKPLNRLDKILSLKHLCRFEIKQNIRKDLIDNNRLPLPDYLLDYLKEKHF